MQENEFSTNNEPVDFNLNQSPGIAQKRIIAFVNHFVVNTFSFLNKLSQNCETKFLEFEHKIQKVEASLLILESQLSSIPGFDKIEPLGESTKPEEATTDNIESAEKPKEQNVETVQEMVGIKASEHPKYSKFFKMLRVGVQENAVKLKMQIEGVNPSILDSPDEIIPDN